MTANHLAFLEALDRHTRSAPSGEVTTGYEMHQVAWAAALTTADQLSAATWTGQLVDLGYVEPGPSLGAARREIPPRVGWTDTELQSFMNYRVTAIGRQEAERLRRHHRERLTDVALGRTLISADRLVSDGAAEAIGRPLRDLRTALDDERPAAAIGAAKELVEAACKVVLVANGQPIGARDSLPALFSQARRAAGVTDGDLGRSMAATVERLGRLRNAAGSGHGRSEAPAVGMAEARLAASSANGLASYLLASQPDRGRRAREDSNL